MAYFANARMYSVNPGAAAAWKELFAWLADASGVDLWVIDHAFPAPLADLWSRPHLGCAFMCGFPYKLSSHPPKPVAAPLPLSSGKAVYTTRLVVKADSRFQSLEDTFGGRLGYTVEDSVATTDAAPIPFLIASRDCPDDVVLSLRATLVKFGEIAACDDLRDRLCLKDFAPVAVADYDLMLRWDAEARAAAYACPG